MNFNAAKLNKLREMSLGDLVSRGQQGLVKLADSLFIANAGEMSDEALYREVLPAARNNSGEGTAELLRDRLREGASPMLPALRERRAIVDAMNRRFPAEREKILARADQAIEGRAGLFGGEPAWEVGHPIDWHRDPRTGDRSPLVHWSRLAPFGTPGKADPRFARDLHRHAHAVTLGQAYWLTGDHGYAEEFVNQVSSWIEANPPGMGIGWVSGLDVSFRAISWLWAMHLCADSRMVHREFVLRLLKSLIEHGRHIEKYHSGNSAPGLNATGEALGLFYLGLALPELRRASAWRKLGLRILLEQLPRAVQADGVALESATASHRALADCCTHFFALLRANEMPLSREDDRMLWQKLESLHEFLHWIQRPDGASPLLGEDEGGRPLWLAPRGGNDFRDSLAMGAAIFKRGDWKRAAGEAPVELLWLLGPEALACYDRIPAEAPAETARAFPNGGYYVMRDGWDAEAGFAIVDCGNGRLAETEPANALSLELALAGTTWLVDPGACALDGSLDPHEAFRSPRARNTAVVDGEDQFAADASLATKADGNGGPSAWEETAECTVRQFQDRPDCVLLEGAHDGYERLSDPVEHTRTVMMLRHRNAAAITDAFVASEAHQYSIQFHFSPGIAVRTSENRVEATSPARTALTINAFAFNPAPRPLRIIVQEGWVSTRPGERDPACVASFVADGTGPIEIITILSARSSDAAQSEPAGVAAGT